MSIGWKALVVALVPLAATAAEDVLSAVRPAAGSEELQEVVVFGRAESKIGVAQAASEGTVGGADLLVRPMLRVAELLEAVPGLIAAQHSGSGKANQYFLRGFNLDHGTDFTTYVDQVPMNLRTHGHGQGYLDVNGLIPEIVDRIDYRKGTYRADSGDFSAAGASYLTTVENFKPFVAGEAGQYGWQRLAGGDSLDLGGGRLSLIGQWKAYDGPWQQPERLQHLAGWGKYALPVPLGMLELSLSAYHATWRPTEQVPERAFGTAVCADEFCALDPTAAGRTLRYIATARLLAEHWQATVYGQYYDWHMSSNPTYDYQIRQFDRRWIGGGRFERQWQFADRAQLSLGVEGRYDDIGNVGVDHTSQGVFVSHISQHAVTEGSLSAFGEAMWKPLPGLRVSGGLRADSYRVQVRAKLPGLDAGNGSAQLLSPKLDVAYALGSHTEFYASWGRGFHSNDARGVVNTTTPVAMLSPAVGYETGMRFEIGDLRLTATYWWLNLASELHFVGDSNSVEPGPATTRRGFELVGFWRPRDWLAFDAVWTGSHARYVDEPGAEFIPGAIESAGEFGVALIRGSWELSARERMLGAYPLIEDNLLRATPEHLLNLRAAWKRRGWQLYGELLNAFNSRGKDIAYYYGTHIDALDGPADPADLDATRIAGRVSRAVEPRTIRIGIKHEF